LAYNATAAQVEAALNALSTIGGLGNSVTVTRGLAEVQRVDVSGGTGAFTLRFKGSPATPALPYNATPLEVQSALNNLSTIGGAGASVSVTGIGTAEQQQVTVGGGNGTFTLTFTI